MLSTQPAGPDSQSDAQPDVPMNKRLPVLLLALVTYLPVTADSAVAQTRDSLRSDFGIELLGKALIYSLSYQYMVTPMLGLEAGVAAVGGSDELVAAFPLGGRVYFSRKSNSPFLTGGGILITSDTFDEDFSTTAGYLGLGFEYRAQSGFLFRGSVYSLIAEGGFWIWPGLNVGYAF